jgi:hypothetical protein
MKRLIDINELSRDLNIPVKTIRNKLSDGSWPIAPLQIGRSLRWDPSIVAKELSLLAKIAKRSPRQSPAVPQKRKPNRRAGGADKLIGTP